MGAYIKIYRAFNPCARIWGHFYVKAYSNDHHEYLWTSRQYPWLWAARWLGPKAACAYIARGLNQLEPSPTEVVELRPLKTGKGSFESQRMHGIRRTRIFIERINL